MMPDFLIYCFKFIFSIIIEYFVLKIYFLGKLVIVLKKYDGRFSKLNNIATACEIIRTV
jgi:hypothetical protein